MCKMRTDVTPLPSSIAIMQPYLFPYLGYYQLAVAAEKFVFLDNVHFINRGWINRNKILSNTGSQYFTVPLSGASQNRRIHEIETLPKANWLPKILKQVQFTYSKAPFYKEVFPLIQSVFESPSELIADLSMNSVSSVLKYLDEPFQTRLSSSYGEVTTAADARIIDICKLEKIRTYINPIGGTELYGAEDFKAQGLELRFIKMGSVIYPQFQNDWVDHLSIIDILMFNEKAKVKDYLRRFTFVE